MTILEDATGSNNMDQMEDEYEVHPASSKRSGGRITHQVEPSRISAVGNNNIVTVRVHKPLANTPTGLRLKNLKEGTGAIITSFKPDSIFTDTNLKVGMQILTVNGINCCHKPPTEVAALLKSLGGSHIPTITIVAALPDATDSSSNGPLFTTATGSATTITDSQQHQVVAVDPSGPEESQKRCCRILCIILSVIVSLFALARAGGAIYSSVEKSREIDEQNQRFRDRNTPRPTYPPTTSRPTEYMPFALYPGLAPTPTTSPTTQRPSTSRPTAMPVPVTPVAFEDGGLGFLRVQVDNMEDPLCVTWHLDHKRLILLECAKSVQNNTDDGTVNNNNKNTLIQRQVFVYNRLGLQQIALNEYFLLPDCLSGGNHRTSWMISQCASPSDPPWYPAQWYQDSHGRLRKVGSGNYSSANPERNTTTDLCLTALVPVNDTAEGYHLTPGLDQENYTYVLLMRPCHNVTASSASSSVGISERNYIDNQQEEYQQIITPPRFWDPVASVPLPIQPKVWGVLQSVTGEGCITLRQDSSSDAGYDEPNTTLEVDECLDDEGQLFIFHGDTRQVEVASGGCVEWSHADNQTVNVRPCYRDNDNTNQSTTTEDIREKQKWYYDKEGRLYHFPSKVSSQSSTNTGSFCLETAPVSAASSAPSSMSSERRLRTRYSENSEKETEGFPDSFKPETSPSSNIFSGNANPNTGTFRPSHPTYASHAPQTLVTRQPSPIFPPAIPHSALQPSGPKTLHMSPCVSQNDQSTSEGAYDRQRFSFVRATLDAASPQPPMMAPTNSDSSYAPVVTRPPSPEPVSLGGATSSPSWTIEPSTPMPGVTARPTPSSRERPSQNG